MLRFWFIAGGVLVIFLVMQLFRPEKNQGELETQDDFIQVTMVPDTLAMIFLNSCYDCHSNHTDYPWYGKLAPASWLLNGHVVDGKAHLNFSSWGLLEKSKQISILDEICEECAEGRMPMRSYLLIHRSANLNAEEIEAICSWSEQEAMNIMSAKE